MASLRPKPATTPASSVTARLAVARDVAQALLSSLDEGELAEAALAHIGRLVPSDASSVLVYDRGTGGLAEAAGAPLDLGDGQVDLAGTFDLAPTGGAPEGVRLSLGDDGQPAALVGALRRRGGRHAIACPLQVRGRAFGLVVLWRRDGTAFLDDDVAAAAEVAGPLSLALDNARLHRDLAQSFASLRNAQAELVRRERMAAVGAMAAVMAHEVRTPLAVLFNAIASLRRIGMPEGDAQVLLSILDEEAERLERLMNDLLEFGRPARRAFAEVDVHELVSDAMDGARRDPRVPETVRLELSTCERVGSACWDAHGVRMALVNLVLNASQAIGGAGGAGQVRVTAEAHPGDRVSLAVEDDGPGIPADARRRLFDPFVTTRPQGMGLGLAVVRRAVDDHLGDLAIRDRGEHGTRFELVLPRRPSAG